MINTAPQILIYEALGAAIPTFAHMPMVLGPDGKKLSKRHAAVAVLEYRDLGYLPDAMLNYLVRLGWSHGDQEIFERDELIEKFDWAHVGSTAAKFDAKKLLHVNAEHLRMSADDRLIERARPFLEARGIAPDVELETFRAALPYLKPRAETLVELADAADYFLRPAPIFEEKARRKFLVPAVAPRLLALVEALEAAPGFTQEALEEAFRAFLEAEALTMKEVAQAARVALSGRTKTPGLYEVMSVLGRERTLRRLREGAALAAESAAG